MKFTNCKITNTKLFYLKSSKINFQETSLAFVDFYKSELVIDVEKSNWSDVRLRSLQIPSSISIVQSDVNDATFDNSTLSDFTITNSKVQKSSSKNTTINTVYIEKSDLAISFDESIIQQLTVNNSTGKCGVSDAQVNKFTMNKHNGELPAWGLLFTEAVISNSQLSEFTLTKSKGDSLTLNSLKSEDTDFENMLVKEFNLNEVEFTVKLDMTNARAEETIANGVILRPGIELLNEGSNIQLR